MLAQWHNGKLRPVKFFHVLLQQWKVVGQPPTRNFLLSSIHLSISDPICLDANSPSSQIMRISSGLPVFPPSSPNLCAGVFLWQSLILKLNIVLVLPMSFQMYLVVLPLTHPFTTGDDLFLSPQPVTCFLTSFIGFDISYLDPSHVLKIFSDALTCLTLTCMQPSPPSMPYSMSQISPF